MSENFLKDYLVQIGQYPLLTADGELELGRRIKEDHDEEARDWLIKCNLRLVVYIAKNYKNAHLPLEDLIMEGNQGLMIAADKFDYTLGYRFSTCATPWIKQAILKSITDQGKTIRLPAHIYAQLNKMKQAMEALEFQGIMDPTDTQIANEMGVEVEKIALLKEWKKDAVSLNTPLNDEEKNTLEDLVPDTHSETPTEYVDRRLQHDKIQNVLSHYPERTQVIIKMRYGLGSDGDPDEFFTEHTLEDIGAYLGITRERVRQIEKMTLQDMKNNWDLLN